jgi:hypothetical protein
MPDSRVLNAAALMMLDEVSTLPSVMTDIGVSALKNGRMNALRFNLRASIRHFDRPRPAESIRYSAATFPSESVRIGGLFSSSVRNGSRGRAQYWELSVVLPVAVAKTINRHKKFL